jgi:hypothetical protein
MLASWKSDTDYCLAQTKAIPRPSFFLVLYVGRTPVQGGRAGQGVEKQHKFLEASSTKLSCGAGLERTKAARK